ncbi:F-box/kelch-repeat protein At3g23880-like [Lotus japonicus]|uniref:F-box/kelch-repeat protein At3g23880-like n=1 Tax=Lotus japonicus TaxID=34305 RepID=UPI002590BD34|nr:F-box/kelch-repeat protein At3g23880-like [Lotus japonicus]
MSRRLSLPVIPEELIYEILLKLPVESLWRFRRVCKSWKTLISHPQFAKDHLDSSISGAIMTQPRLALVYDDSNTATTYSVNSLFKNPPTLTEKLKFKMEGKHNHFVGSINGLLCLRDVNCCFRLYNPSTKLVSRKSPAFPIEIKYLFPNNAFFGYDKVNDKYKVLAFGVDLGYHVFNLVARLYTFGESESNWRTTIQDLSFGVNNIEGSRQTFVNGNLHWLTKRGHGSDKTVIISFDVDRETHGEVLLPLELEDIIWSLDLHVSNKFLYVSQYSHKTCLVLWLMKEYGVQESWTKVMTISLESRYCRCNATHLSPLCILGNDVVVLRNACSCPYLVTYDSKNGQFGRRFRIERSSPRQWHGGVYHESLVPPP